MPTITLVNNTAISGLNTYGPFSVPAGATGNILFSCTLNSADLTNTSLSLSLEIDDSVDGGATWRFNAGSTWQGGLKAVSPWILQFDVADVAGKQVRVIINAPLPMTITSTTASW